MDRAGRAAQASVLGELAGISQSGVLGTDGLWTRLRGGTKGMFSLLRTQLAWVQYQRCVWHIQRKLAGMGAQAAAQAAQVAGDVAEQVRNQVRAELTALVHGVIDAQSDAQAEAALLTLLSHPQGSAVGQLLNEQLDRLLVHLLASYQGLQRVTPEWCWRDFRLRLSHSRNHRSAIRLERVAPVWAIYRNCEPAQARSERNRHYRRHHRNQARQHKVEPSPFSGRKTMNTKTLGPGVHTIQQKSSGRYVDAHNNANDFALITRPSQDFVPKIGHSFFSPPTWVLTPMGGVYTIQQRSSGRFVDAHEIAEKDYAIVTRPAQNDDTQRWIISEFVPEG